jgi:nitrogen fixation/metabolism regulation signal transduction histidine kinase
MSDDSPILTFEADPDALKNIEVEELSDSDPIKDYNVISEKREDTRGRLAMVFLLGFFVILLVALIVAVISSDDKVTAIKEVVLAISGILSGPLGFVVGYYFRSKEED